LRRVAEKSREKRGIEGKRGEIAVSRALPKKRGLVIAKFAIRSPVPRYALFLK